MIDCKVVLFLICSKSVIDYIVSYVGSFSHLVSDKRQLCEQIT